MTKKQQETTLLKNPLRTWQFWTICIAVLMYFIDIFLQLFLFKDIFQSIASLVLFFMIGAEAYMRLKFRKTYLGYWLAVALSIFSIVTLPILYI